MYFCESAEGRPSMPDLNLRMNCFKKFRRARAGLNFTLRRSKMSFEGKKPFEGKRFFEVKKSFEGNKF